MALVYLLVSLALATAQYVVYQQVVVVRQDQAVCMDKLNAFLDAAAADRQHAQDRNHAQQQWFNHQSQAWWQERAPGAGITLTPIPPVQ